MKILKTVTFLLCGAVILSSCDSKKIGKTALKTEIDSVSYAIGISIGNNFKNSKIEDANVKAVASAIENVLDKDSTNDVMTIQDASKVINKYFQAKQKAEREKELKKYEGNIQIGKTFFEENAKKEGVIVDASGLQYKVVKEGKGPQPQETDIVKVHYKGSLIDGTEFDSSYSRNEPVQFPLNQVIKGWTIGLQKMKVGSKYILYIPYELGYGENMVSEKIPPYSTLIFEVELLEIVKEKK